MVRILDTDPIVRSESADDLPPLAKYFREKEQVCIRGIGWRTHGLVSKIAREGIWLYQLGNAKELLYTWDSFEVVHHPGCVVHESSPAELVDIFDLEITRYDIDAVREAVRSVYEPGILEWPFVCENQLGFREGELRVALCRGNSLPMSVVLEASVNGTIWKDSLWRNGVCLKGEEAAQLVGSWAVAKLVEVTRGFDSPPPGTAPWGLSADSAIEAIRKEGYAVIAKRMNKPRESSTRCGLGDPYTFEGGVLVDHNVFLTAQGYIAGSCHSKNGSRLYL